MARRGSPLLRILSVANVVGASASALFAIVGAVRPTFVRPGSQTNPLAQFWAASSAVRTLAVTSPLIWRTARGRQPSPQLLRTAGIVQLFDAGLGRQQHNPPMIVLPAIMGVVHLISAHILTAAAYQ